MMILQDKRTIRIEVSNAIDGQVRILGALSVEPQASLKNAPNMSRPAKQKSLQQTSRKV